MEKTAIRREVRVNREHASDDPAPFRNEPAFQTPTGGIPLKAHNAWMVEGNTDLERYTGGDQVGTSEDDKTPAHPGQPTRNEDAIPKPKMPPGLEEAARREIAMAKKAAKLRLDQVLPRDQAEQLKRDLEREQRKLMDYVNTELMLKNPKIAAALSPEELCRAWELDLMRSLKQAGEENEPKPDRHASSPKSMLRPRAEIIIASPDGVYAIDKGDYILFPGGGIDDGEPPIVGAIRETIEEADIHVLNIDQKDVVESLWPLNSGNDFWDDSEFDGERTYFFAGIDGGSLGTSHADRENFEVIPFDDLIARFDELMEDDSKWDYRNNEVRRSLVKAAKGMSTHRGAFLPKKLAVVKQHTDLGWARYKRSLRKVFSPKDPDAFARALQEVEAECDHNCHEVRRFPNGSVLVVLRTEEGDSDVTSKDHSLARRINGLAKTAGVKASGTMQLTLGASSPDGYAPGIVVDLDGTIVDSDWESDPGIMREQSAKSEAKQVLELFSSMGFRIIGVTNRSADSSGVGHTPEEIQALNEETMGMFPELIDVVFCADNTDECRKPSPAMLEFAAQHFKLDPLIAMVGDSDDDAGAAAAAGIMFFSPEEFFNEPSVYRAVLNLGAQSDGPGEDTELKVADVASLLPRQEYVYLDDDGRVLVKPGENRRFSFPTAGTGRKAPYSVPLRIVPEEGIDDPGHHGYEYTFNLGSGNPPLDFGGEWMPADKVLKQMYGSMGLSVNKPHRQLDRARARVIHRAMRKAKAPQDRGSGGGGIPQSTPREHAMEEDRVAEASRPEEPTPPEQTPWAVSGDDWREHQRELVQGSLLYS